MKQKKIIFATKNKGKMKEITEIMKNSPYLVISQEDAGITTEIVENGKTFAENATLKALAIAKETDCIALADDSGLEIDYLNKEPGIYSARYMGTETPYSVKNTHILSLLKDVPAEKRTARFVCAIAVAIPKTGDTEILTVSATIEGIIGYKITGDNGFGYDPIFYVPEYGLTTAEMPIELKNKISHRGKALQQMKKVLLERFDVL